MHFKIHFFIASTLLWYDMKDLSSCAHDYICYTIYIGKIDISSMYLGKPKSLLRTGSAISVNVFFCRTIRASAAKLQSCLLFRAQFALETGVHEKSVDVTQ